MITCIKFSAFEPYKTCCNVNRMGNRFQPLTMYMCIKIQIWLLIVVSPLNETEMKITFCTTSHMEVKMKKCITSTILQPILSFQCLQGMFKNFKKLINSFVPSKSVIGCPCFKKWKILANYMNFRFYPRWTPFVTWMVIEKCPWKCAYYFSFLICCLFEFK
jgi:hypothetical protein